MLVVACLCLFLGDLSVARAEDIAVAAPRFSLLSTEGVRAAVVDRQTTNPLTSAWVVALQNDFSFWNGDLPGAADQQANLFQIAPSIPIHLPFAPDYHVVNQFSFPVRALPIPFFTPTGVTFDEKAGFGDIIMANYLSRSFAHDPGWILGAGPTWIFPSASSEYVGQGKYQLGPSLLGGYLGVDSPFWAYVAIQQWWSIAGDSDRANTSQMALQYFYQINLNAIDGMPELPGGRWAIGAAPVVIADWRAREGNTWSVPIGTGLVYFPIFGELKLPRLALEFDYYPERPDLLGPDWNIRFALSVGGEMPAF